MSFKEQRKGQEGESVNALKSEIVGHLNEMQRSIEQAKQVAYVKVTNLEDIYGYNNSIVCTRAQTDLLFLYFLSLDPRFYPEESGRRCSVNATQIS